MNKSQSFIDLYIKNFKSGKKVVCESEEKPKRTFSYSEGPKFEKETENESVMAEGDVTEEGAIWLSSFVEVVHSLGIYDALRRLSVEDVERIKKYDPETATKLIKAKTIVDKELLPLVRDLNGWYKNFHRISN